MIFRGVVVHLWPETRLRSAEWISVGFFSLLLVAGAFARLERGRRRKAMGIGLAGILAAVSLQFLGGRPSAVVVRDLAPGVLLLMGYWQSGQFFTGGDSGLQRSLQRLDDRWFPGVMRITASLDTRRVLSTYFEAAYFMCYLMLPLGIAVLYLTGQRETSDWFWTVVLPPTFLCYGVTILFQSLPPRLVGVEDPFHLRGSNLRSLNESVLRHAGIRVNTLPSGHVTSSLAVALVLLELSPVAGVISLWIAGSIAMGTVVLRYHYSVDAVLGIAVALLSFMVFR